MKIYLAPDSDLRAFEGAPKTLQMWLGTRPQPPITLGRHWRTLTALVGSAYAPSGGPLTSAGADYRYPTAADHGAFGLSSPSTARLLKVLTGIDLGAVERFVQTRTGDQGAQDDSDVDGNPDELLRALRPLNDACELAATRHYGLVVALWDED